MPLARGCETLSPFGSVAPEEHLRFSRGARGLRGLALSDYALCGVTAQGAVRCAREDPAVRFELSTGLGAAGMRAAVAGRGLAGALSPRGGAMWWTVGVNEWDFLPTTLAGVPEAVQLAAGDNFLCALSTRGRVFCMGDNQNGQLGVGRVDFDHLHPMTVRWPMPAE